MEQKLKDYTGGKIHYTPIANIIMNNRSKNWYAELGKYITENLDIETIPELSWLAPRLKEKKNLVTKIKDFLNDDNQLYFSVASFFLTSALSAKKTGALKKMFGEPILHDEFGEGFEGEYDEETDEYGQPAIKESFASYFVDVEGTNFHIGYDHRGTIIEVETSEFDIDNVSSDDDAKKCFESLKKLVDLYKLKN
jgi:hypothetical protein